MSKASTNLSRRRKPARRRPIPRPQLVALGLFLILCVFNLLPIAWGILTSVKSSSEVLTYPPVLFGFTPTLEHYDRLVGGGFFRSVRNSLFYSLSAVGVGLLLASLAAYGFDRFQFWGRSTAFLLVVSSIPLSIGAAALIIPNYLYFTDVGLTNRWVTLPIIYTAYNLPMAIWIMKGSMEGVPRELDEAALIDGCTRMSVLWRIVLPLCKPAIAAAALFIFIGSWNEFIAGSVMVNDSAQRPVQVAIYQFIGYFGRQWGPLTAAATVAVVPILIVFAFLGRLLVSGLTQGSVKG